MDIIQNAVSAICIGGIIAAMGMVKSPRLKAFIFSLPISITTALIATGATVSASNVIGLLFLDLFLWVVLALYRAGIPILLADIAGAAMYLLAGYGLLHLVQLSFFDACLLYMGAWVLFILWQLRRSHPPEIGGKTSVHPVVKVATVSTIAYVLLALKQYLAGIIVTFPFAAVFAVVEGRHVLHSMVVAFCRNSIAILTFFVTVYMLQDLAVFAKIGFGWAAYAVALWVAMQVPHEMTSSSRYVLVRG